jgi:hypothetical protein
MNKIAIMSVVAGAALLCVSAAGYVFYTRYSNPELQQP